MYNLNHITIKLLPLIASLLLAVNVRAQDILFADPHLKAVLVANNQVNTNGDGEIQKAEALAFTGLLDVSSSSIYNMAGIEYFQGITSLDCRNNSITSLNLSSNSNIVRLNCSNNKLHLLNVDKCTDLLTLDCNNNNLTDIDLSFNLMLNLLYCQDNKLSDLDLSVNTDLQQLDCSSNQISTLNVSNNSYLSTFNCSNNQLTELNIANNNNNNIQSSSFDAKNNNLNCIQVDDAHYSMQNWSTKIDSFAYFSISCIVLGEQTSNTEYLGTLKVYPNPVGEVFTVELEKTYFNVTLEIYNVFGRRVIVKNFKEFKYGNINLDLNSGVYILTIKSEEGMAKSTSIIKS
ncbi:MAG: T9SS type A sorting domain-containing protein [Saprospiraceae bacterium]|nr:T9SS type A sorting domain-containing protein [Saprospiraceae bacterium]